MMVGLGAASALLLADVLASAKHDLGLLLLLLADGDASVEDLLDEVHEGVFHALAGLGRGLAEEHALLGGEGLGRGGLDHSLVVHVGLVAHQQLGDVAARVALDLVEPHLGVVERGLIGDVVHHDDAVRPSVVAARDGTEPLLASCRARRACCVS